jgi:hypothetical protein
MRKFKLDGTVFKDEYGKLSPNAFDVLNNTFGSKYGTLNLFKEAIGLVSKNFSVIIDNKKDYEYDYTNEYVIEHFNEVTKMYYKLVEIRKKIDYQTKLDDINNDF